VADKDVTFEGGQAAVLLINEAMAGVCGFPPFRPFCQKADSSTPLRFAQNDREDGAPGICADFRLKPRPRTFPLPAPEFPQAMPGGVLNLRWWKTTSGCFSFLTILSSRHAIESNGTLDAQESAQPGRQDSGLCPGVA
jgi:hypothetical protein